MAAAGANERLSGGGGARARLHPGETDGGKMPLTQGKPEISLNFLKILIGFLERSIFYVVFCNLNFE